MLIFSSLKSSNFKKTFHFELPIFLPHLHCSEILKLLLDSSTSDFSSLDISNFSLGSQVAHFEKHCSTLIKNVLFHSYCLQFYSSQLWCNCLKSSYHRIKIAYNDAIRMLHNFPRSTYAQNSGVTKGGR